MNFALYATRTKVCGHHVHMGKQLDRDVSEDHIAGNSVVWNTTAKRPSNDIFGGFGLDNMDLDSILNKECQALFGRSDIAVTSTREQAGNFILTPGVTHDDDDDDDDDDVMQQLLEQQLVQQEEDIEEFAIPSPVDSTEELLGLIEEQEREEEELLTCISTGEGWTDYSLTRTEEVGDTVTRDVYNDIREKTANLVTRGFKLPTLPESDIEVSFTKIPSHFGSKFDDVEWDRFATEFYSALKTINKTIAYWMELIIQHKSKWENLAALHLKIMSGQCESEEELLQDMEELRTSTVSDVHFSCKDCLNLDPFNLNTGLHFCYFYWVKIMVTSMACYRDLVVYFLKGNTVQNFTKVVRMPGFKNNETGLFCQPHQTSMTMSICMELNRLRLVCRSPKIWPLSPESFLYYFHEDTCVLEYARNHTLIRSHANRRSPMVLSLRLASSTRANQTLPNDIKQYNLTKQKQKEYAETLSGSEVNQATEAKFSARELEHTSKTLFELVQEQGIISVSVLEELSGGLMWRFNTFWHTASFDAYLDLLLDKIALYFLGPHTNEIMDDPLFRIKVSGEHERYSIQTVQEGLSKMILTEVDNSWREEGEEREILETMGTGAMELEEEEEEEVQEEFQVNTQRHEHHDHLSYHCGKVTTVEEQLGTQFLMNVEKDLGSSEIFIINQDFLFYTNSILAEVHLSKYYRNRYAQAKWEFLGETLEEREFKRKYFMAIRAFFKYWARHRRVTNTDMLRDTASTKYSRLMTTQCEFNWFKYYTSVTLKDTSKLVSTTNSKLIQVLRPFEKEALGDMAGQNMKVLFDYHRVDSRHRGYGDWLRLMLAGSVFASSIPEFTADKSKYILHHEQTLSNFTWFQQENFPFIWYWGGRYYVYCNKFLWHAFDLPHDLVDRIKNYRLVDPETYYTEGQLSDTSQKGREALKKQLEKECAQVNKINDFDNHAYLGPNIEETQCLLYQELFGSCDPSHSGEDQGDEEINSAEVRTGEVEGEDEEDVVWEQFRANKDTPLAEYECIAALAVEELEKIQERCLPEVDYDNGDTLYDTLALWAFMVQENHSLHPKLAKAIMEGIQTSCDILLQKSNGGTQKDFPLLQITPDLLELKEMVDKYERNYI